MYNLLAHLLNYAKFDLFNRSKFLMDLLDLINKALSSLIVISFNWI